MSDTLVQLGFNISDYNYDDTAEKLYVSGPALEEGLWSDSIGGTFFYPSHVIQRAAHLFYDKDFVCEHRNLPIGKSTKITLNNAGFSIDGYFDNKDSIKAVINKDKLGFSIKANIRFNPITRVVEEIYDVQHIALVQNPACKICGITSAYTDKGNVIMSAKKAKTEEIVDPVEVDNPPVEESVELKKGTGVDEVIVDAGVEETSPNTTVPSVSIKTDSIVIEQPFSEVMAALSAATSTVENVSTQLTSAIARLQDMEAKCSSLEVQLSAKDSEIATIKTEAESYKTQFEALQNQLNNQAEIERNNLVAEIKGLDPEISNDIIESMSIVQLSAYKGSLDRFTVKGMIPGERRGFKADEQVPESITNEVALSEPTAVKELSRTQLCELVCAALQEKRVTTN